MASVPSRGPQPQDLQAEMWILQRMEFPEWSCHRCQADAFFLAPLFTSLPLQVRWQKESGMQPH